MKTAKPTPAAYIKMSTGGQKGLSGQIHSCKKGM